jgi:Hypothetical glycosyl hydrolase family 15
VGAALVAVALVAVLAVVAVKKSLVAKSVTGKAALWRLRQYSLRQYGLIVVGLLVVASGIALLAATTTPFASLTAYNGSLTGAAAKVSDSSASNGQGYVRFGSTATTGKDEGKSRYKLDASSFFDPYATTQWVPWAQAHVTLLEGYPSFSDKYVQLFGLPLIGYRDPAYPVSSVTGLNSSQIQTYVSWADGLLQKGYVGNFVDDANWKSGASPGSPAQLAALMTTMRAKDPNILIEMNSQYHDIWPIMQNPSDPDYPYVEQALSAVNILCKEFGVGPTSGIGSASDYASFMKYVDTLHGKGIHIDMTSDYQNYNPPTLEYNLATYFLVNDGGDYVGGADPRSTSPWSPRFDVNLGNATSGRSRSASGVWTRTFTNGVVYTVEPGASTQTITLPAPMKEINTGNTVSSVTLGPASGVVLTK